MCTYNSPNFVELVLDIVVNPQFSELEIWKFEEVRTTKKKRVDFVCFVSPLIFSFLTFFCNFSVPVT